MYCRAVRCEGGKRRRTSRRVSPGFLHPWKAPPRPPRRLPAATAYYVYCIPVEIVLCFYSSKERESVTPIFLPILLPLHFHVPHVGADSFIVKNTNRVKGRIFRWLVRRVFIFTTISFVSGERYFKVWRESSRRRINFNSDKNIALRQRVEGVRVVGKRKRELNLWDWIISIAGLRYRIKSASVFVWSL